MGILQINSIANSLLVLPDQYCDAVRVVKISIFNHCRSLLQVLIPEYVSWIRMQRCVYTTRTASQYWSGSTRREFAIELICNIPTLLDQDSDRTIETEFKGFLCNNDTNHCRSLLQVLIPEYVSWTRMQRCVYTTRTASQYWSGSTRREFAIELICNTGLSLFRFTGKGGIVRKVPNKPARVGIWHYQAVVTLPDELPYLVYTRVHNTSANMGENTPTSMIVLEWADIIQSFRQPTTLAMDSYYLDNNGRQRLLERGVRYVAALKPSLRFHRAIAESGRSTTRGHHLGMEW